MLFNEFVKGLSKILDQQPEVGEYEVSIDNIFLGSSQQSGSFHFALERNDISGFAVASLDGDKKIYINKQKKLQGQV